MLPEVDEIIEVDYAEAELRYAAGLVREGHITWQNLIETVVSDRLEEDEEPRIEVYGPSPVEVVSPLLEVLRQFPHQHYRREYEGGWPDLTQEELERLKEIRNMPDDQKVMLHWLNVALCTPSRHPITGGE